jgi:hypothetical protein
VVAQNTLCDLVPRVVLGLRQDMRAIGVLRVEMLHLKRIYLNRGRVKVHMTRIMKKGLTITRKKTMRSCNIVSRAGRAGREQTEGLRVQRVRLASTAGKVETTTQETVSKLSVTLVRPVNINPTVCRQAAGNANQAHIV